MKWLNQLQRLDEMGFLWLSVTLRRATAGSLVLWVSRSGDGYAYVAICIGTWVIQSPLAPGLTSLLLAGYALELPIYWLLKNSLRRPRPCTTLRQIKALIRASDQFSFPSGHTTAAFLFAGIVSGMAPQFSFYCYVWASSIGLSRVALGVHYPTDVVAGAGLGSLLAALTFILVGGL